jgi:hypothetical protein
VPKNNPANANNYQAELIKGLQEMNKEAAPNEHKLKTGDTKELAILASNERICTDAQPSLDPDSIRRFCQVWGEVGRAILNRRDKGDNAQGKTRFDYPGGCVHQSI